VADLTNRQIARNRETRDQPSFASHREHVMRLITTASLALRHVHRPSISIIGAGNCQDIDLSILAKQFREIRLFDIDEASVNLASAKPLNDEDGNVRIFAPIDIAAPLMSDEAINGHANSLSPEFLNALEAASIPVDIPPSDVVVSTCLLSQLIDSASQIVTPDAPGFLPLIQAVRRGHLARLLVMTARGGRTLLITDLVSSDTLPDLKSIAPGELPKRMTRCLDEGNFFSGLNPAIIKHDLENIPALKQHCTSFRILPPWTWQLGPRCFAVYAVEMVRTG
jgi:hypothetical protein